MLALNMLTPGPALNQLIRNTMTVFRYGYQSFRQQNAGLLETANDAARFVIKIESINTKIHDSWRHDILQAIPVAILASESPEKLVSF